MGRFYCAISQLIDELGTQNQRHWRGNCSMFLAKYVQFQFSQIKARNKLYNQHCNFNMFFIGNHMPPSKKNTHLYTNLAWLPSIYTPSICKISR